MFNRAATGLIIGASLALGLAAWSVPPLRVSVPGVVEPRELVAATRVAVPARVVLLA